MSDLSTLGLGTGLQEYMLNVQADEYLQKILAREQVDTSQESPIRKVQVVLLPSISLWANGNLLSVHPSGSFIKGTANRSGTDIDLFISLSPNTPNTLKDIYDYLFNRLSIDGYAPKRQNVSINVMVNGYSVDIVPAKRQNMETMDHSLYRSKKDSWIKTDVLKHIMTVRAANTQREIRIIKLWRRQKNLDFPSFYLELAVINALANNPSIHLSVNVQRIFDYLRDSFSTARIVDPANTNNVVSDGMTIEEKRNISSAAKAARGAPYWGHIVQ
jgi:hypothetical protein